MKTLTKKERTILHSGFSESCSNFERDTIELFSKNIRGSVRLATGRYYTKKEMEERAKKAFSVKLY